MNPNYFEEKINKCLRDEKAFCSNACPFDIDIRDFLGKIQKGLFTQAYNAYAKTVLFPNIVSRLCPEMCKNNCIRCGIDEPVLVGELEKSLSYMHKNQVTPAYYIPEKNKSVQIIGGGLCALACGIKLAQSGYRVDLYEKNPKTGGTVWNTEENILPQDLIEEEIQNKANQRFLNIFTDADSEEINLDYDAVFVATGFGGNTFGAEKRDNEFFLDDKVFFGGSLVNGEQSKVLSVQQGIYCAKKIDAFLRKVKLITPKPQTAFFKPDTEKILSKNPVKPIDENSWTEAEIKEEASRCIQCRCNNCMEVCDMHNYYGREPKKTLGSVAETIFKSQWSRKTAHILANSCTNCGACKDACPVGIDFSQIYKDSRRVMHLQGVTPPAYHEYWINDLIHSNSDAALVKPAKKTTNYLLFPGCQLGATDPAYVVESYRLLSELLDNEVGIMYQCCGAPAYWDGNLEMFSSTCDNIRNSWEELGKPVMVTICPSCYALFKEQLPDIPNISIWELLAEKFEPLDIGNSQKITVFDPCSSSEFPEMQKSVRKLIEKIGFIIEEAEAESSACCGYGGLIYGANPDLYDKINEKNITASKNDFIAYCTNCREAFVKYKKPTYYLLELLLFKDTNRKSHSRLSLTQRRKNKENTKKALLKEFWQLDEKENPKKIKLVISDELVEKMDALLIHEENLSACILYAEENGSKIFNNERKSYTAHLLQGIITFWVEYQKNSDGSFSVLNAYKHRMSIIEKGDIDG